MAGDYTQNRDVKGCQAVVSSRFSVSIKTDDNHREATKGCKAVQLPYLCNLEACNLLVASRWPNKTHLEQTYRIILIQAIPLHFSYGVQRCYVMRLCVHMYVTNCHRKRTAENLYVNFHPNCQRPWPNFQGQKFERLIIREYLANDDTWDKRYHCQHKESWMWSFDWFLYIWSWSILTVTVRHISTVNISQTVTDKSNIITAVKYDFA